MKRKRKQHPNADRAQKISSDSVQWTNKGGVPVNWKIGKNDVVWVAPNTRGMSAVRDIGISVDRDLPIFYPKGVMVVKDPAPLEKEVVAPPVIGEFLIELFCTKNRVDAVMGDLEERFHEQVRSKGEQRARLLYWAGLLRSIGPLLWVKVRKAGLIALLFEIGRRWGGLS
jgi:hypothetical protein